MKALKDLFAVQEGIGQSKSRELFLRIMFGMSLMLVIASVQAESPPDETGWRLDGTWVVSVDPPGQFPPTHIAFTSFIKGGVMIGSPDIYLPPPILRIDNVHGSWKRIEGQEFASTFVAYAYNDPYLQPQNTIKINSSYRLTSKNSFEGESQLLLCDLDLKCPAPGPGVAKLHGTRLIIEPVSP